MLPDLLSVGLRGLSFIAMAQATGAVLFLVLFGPMLGESWHRILRTGQIATVAALLILPAQFAMEAGRMAGTFSGVLDMELQRFALSTAAATVLATRMIALVLLAVVVSGSGRALRSAGVLGVVLIAVSFALTGHTTASPLRWLLGPLIVLHVLVVCFWFGALRPLTQVVIGESPAIGARVVARFSRIAGISVPMILLAGVAVAAWLLPDMNALLSAYGLGLIAKVLAFATLMGLAVLNKWNLGPLLDKGGSQIRHRFLRVVAVEWVLIALVLAGTACLTELSSPT